MEGFALNVSYFNKESKQDKIFLPIKKIKINNIK